MATASTLVRAPTWPRPGASSTLQDGRERFSSATASGGSVVDRGSASHPKVVGLVYVAARTRPMSARTKPRSANVPPSGLARTPGAIARTPDGYTYLTPSRLPDAVRARPALASRRSSRRVRRCRPPPRSSPRRSTRRRVADQAELGNRRRQRPDHQSGARTLLLPAGRQPHDRHQGREPFGLPVACRPGRRRDRERRARGRVGQLTLPVNRLYG